MSIGKNIAKYRKALGLTQEELGVKLGVTNQAVSKWEMEVSMPDILLLPQIAVILNITLEDLFAEHTVKVSQTKSDVFNMDAVHNFPKEAQTLIINTLYHQTNLVNCGSWDFLKVEQNPSSKMYDSIKRHHTLCCLSDVSGAAFVSDNLTMIDSGITPTYIGSLFEKPEIASGIKKLSDSNVRRVLSHVCNKYFSSRSPFDCTDSEYFVVEIKLGEISRATELTADNVLEALEKLISLHIVELQTNSKTQYLLHKVKAIEAAVTFRLIERLIHNEVGMGCGDFLSLIQL